MSSHVTQPGAPESPHQNGERGSESRRQGPIITLISLYLQTLSPVIPPVRSVSGKPSTKCTRIHRTNTSRSAIPAVVLIYTKLKRR